MLPAPQRRGTLSLTGRRPFPISDGKGHQVAVFMGGGLRNGRLVGDHRVAGPKVEVGVKGLS